MERHREYDQSELHEHHLTTPETTSQPEVIRDLKPPPGIMQPLGDDDGLNAGAVNI